MRLVRAVLMVHVVLMVHAVLTVIWCTVLMVQLCTVLTVRLVPAVPMVHVHVVADRWGNNRRPAPRG
ncbi:hypothetical protein AB5J52_13480 [Streptomyces sp. R39]|uniref:Secreted peptide n=1 Tax=Streptomyces sp. R39 TaxID=3238631 RepID=A0AB39QLB2_9ACTN